MWMIQKGGSVHSTFIGARSRDVCTVRPHRREKNGFRAALVETQHARVGSRSGGYYDVMPYCVYVGGAKRLGQYKDMGLRVVIA